MQPQDVILKPVLTEKGYDGMLKRMGRNEGYTPTTKKAIVTLKADSKPIEAFNSLS